MNGDDPWYLDTSSSISKANLFVYCDNNPISYVDVTGNWVSRAIVASVSGAIFGGIAYAIGRAVGLRGKKLAVLVAGCIAAGVAIGLWKGISILYSINRLVKPVIYFFSNPGKVYFGLKLFSIIQFEIHNPHHNKPIHFVIRVFLKGITRKWEWWW